LKAGERNARFPLIYQLLYGCLRDFFAERQAK